MLEKKLSEMEEEFPRSKKKNIEKKYRVIGEVKNLHQEAAKRTKKG